jgi:hypothetical protein
MSQVLQGKQSIVLCALRDLEYNWLRDQKPARMFATISVMESVRIAQTYTHGTVNFSHKGT